MKNKIIISAVSVVLLIAVVFGWLIFTQKKSINISVQNPIAEIAEQPASDVVNDAAPVDQPAENIAPEKIVPSEPAPAKNNTQNNLASVPDSTENAEKIVNHFVSWGFQKSSGRKIDTIIIHSSYDALGSDPYSIDGIIAEYKQYEVSAHYLIARDGAIYRLVADQNIAWHAGVATMPDGRTGVNAFSLGIEMVNTQDGKFTAAQYAALNSLIASLKKQYPIKYILGHSDIAPGRKTDPWNIDWSKVQK